MLIADDFIKSIFNDELLDHQVGEAYVVIVIRHLPRSLKQWTP
jgi:hypothetical protein